MEEQDLVLRLMVLPAAIEQEAPDNLRKPIKEQLWFVSPAERGVLEAASVAGMASDRPAVAGTLRARRPGLA